MRQYGGTIPDDWGWCIGLEAVCHQNFWRIKCNDWGWCWAHFSVSDRFCWLSSPFLFSSCLCLSIFLSVCSLYYSVSCQFLSESVSLDGAPSFSLVSCLSFLLAKVPANELVRIIVCCKIQWCQSDLWPQAWTGYRQESKLRLPASCAVSELSLFLCTCPLRFVHAASSWAFSFCLALDSVMAGWV